MCVKLHFGDLNSSSCPPYSINIYICEVTTAPKVRGDMENYLWSMEKSYKNKAYFFIGCFLEKKNGKQSLSHAAHNSYKYYLLLTQEIIFYFTHSVFLTINSLISSLPFVFSLFSHPHYHPLWSLLFPQISLFICLSSLFSPYFFSPL